MSKLMTIQDKVNQWRGLKPPAATKPPEKVTTDDTAKTKQDGPPIVKSAGVGVNKPTPAVVGKPSNTTKSSIPPVAKGTDTKSVVRSGVVS